MEEGLVMSIFQEFCLCPGGEGWQCKRWELLLCLFQSSRFNSEKNLEIWTAFCLHSTLSSGFPTADSEKCSIFSVLEREMRSLEVILHLFFRLFTKAFPQSLSLNRLVIDRHFGSYSYFCHDWCLIPGFAEEISTNIVANFPILLVLFNFLEHYLHVSFFIIYSPLYFLLSYKLILGWYFIQTVD